jgi:hypothetical protein
MTSGRPSPNAPNLGPRPLLRYHIKSSTWRAREWSIGLRISYSRIGITKSVSLRPYGTRLRDDKTVNPRDLRLEVRYFIERVQSLCERSQMSDLRKAASQVISPRWAGNRSIHEASVTHHVRYCSPVPLGRSDFSACCAFLARSLTP